MFVYTVCIGVRFYELQESDNRDLSPSRLGDLSAGLPARYRSGIRDVLLDREEFPCFRFGTGFLRH